MCVCALGEFGDVYVCVCVCVEGLSTKHWPVEEEREILCVTESIGSLFTLTERQLAISTN